MSSVIDETHGKLWVFFGETENETPPAVVDSWNIVFGQPARERTMSLAAFPKSYSKGRSIALLTATKRHWSEAKLGIGLHCTQCGAVNSIQVKFQRTHASEKVTSSKCPKCGAAQAFGSYCDFDHIALFLDAGEAKHLKPARIEFRSIQTRFDTMRQD